MKFSTILGIFVALLPFGAQANEGFFFKPYAGAAYDYMHASYKQGGDQIAENSLNGFDIHIGARLHRYFGVEAAYLQTEHAGKSNVLGLGVNTTVQFKGGTFDIMGYLPVTDNGKLELVGTAGLSVLKGNLQLKGAGGHISLSESETKPRIGAGAQYWLTGNLNARGLVRYQAADYSNSVNNAIITSLGLNWQF